MSAAAEPSSDPSARAAQRLAMLAELAEIGMDLARALGHQGAAEACDETRRGDLALGFTRVARAVRQTLALEARLAEALAAGPAPDARERTNSDTDTSGARRWVNRLIVHDLVEEAIEAEAGDDEAAERLFEDLSGRLAGEDYDIGEQPIGLTLKRICRDLGLRPDWDRWAGEPWALEEAEARERGSPYGRPNLKPRRPVPADARPPDSPFSLTRPSPPAGMMPP